jgi:hypothetical protein
MSDTHLLTLPLHLSLAVCLSTGVTRAQEPPRDDFKPIVFGDPADHAYDTPFFEPTVYD